MESQFFWWNLYIILYTCSKRWIASQHFLCREIPIMRNFEPVFWSSAPPHGRASQFCFVALRWSLKERRRSFVFKGDLLMADGT